MRFILWLGLAGAMVASINSVQTAQVSARDLMETGSLQRRWMTLPNSRIVVNPYDFNSRQTPLQQSGGPELPLHLAYYAGGESIGLRNSLMLHEHLRAEPSKIVVGWKASLKDESSWQSEPAVQLITMDSSLQVTATGPNGDCSYCGSTTQAVEINLDTFPYLRVNVPAAIGHWSLKVRDPQAERDVTLQTDTRLTGVFAFDVRKATGWSGRRKFTIKFYAINIGHPVTLSELAFVGASNVNKEPADKWENTWYPHQLVADATFRNGSAVSTLDTFVDIDSVQRKFGFRSLTPGATFSLSGAFSGKLDYDDQNQILTITSSTSTLALAFSGVKLQGRPTVHQTTVEYLAGVETTQPVASSPAIWSLQFTVPMATLDFNVGVGFSTVAEGADKARDRASAAAAKIRPDLLQEQVWNDYLARVPQPTSFNLHHVDPLEVTSTDVGAAYYKAWIFTAANLLPVMPETGFLYPQLAAGKPSMWADGHPKARATASWESLFAMQLYAHVDADAAWNAFTGLMSLVDEEGRLGGESLPSRKAQTALVLYHLSKDKEKLRTIYPALKRYLLWRRDNPRWIHKAHDYPDEKDSDFVVSAIMDMKHASEIASTIDLPEEKEFWKQERQKLFANYLQWFWKAPTSDPDEIYFTTSGKRSSGISLWVAAGIHLDLLKDGPHLDGLYRVYKDELKPDKPFLGFGIPKYPEISFLVYGLIERGKLQDAAALANAAVRDVTRANMFAEQYSVSAFPEPDGVRPSMFGAAMLIDMLWIKNGVRFDTGKSVYVTLPGETGTVKFPGNTGR